MKTRTRIWWILAALLFLLAGSAWVFEMQIARQQKELLNQLGEDISANQQKWEGATVKGSSTFHWWGNLGLGHGLIQLTGQISRFALLALVIQLGITLYWRRRT